MNKNLSSVAEKKYIIDEETSKRITSLRYPLMVLIIFLHNSQEVTNFGDYSVAADIPLVVKGIKFFFLDCMCPIAVPLFFFFSGFLLFSEVYSFKQLIHKKCRSIFIPYILWLLLYIFFLLILQSIPQLSIFFSNPNNSLKDFGIIDWIGAFVGRDLDNNHWYTPLAVQFWFIRDLLIVTLFSPIIRFIYNKSPIFLLSMVTCLYFHPLFLYPQLTIALFYMVIGLLIAKNNWSVKQLDMIRFVDILISVVIIWILKFVCFYKKTNIEILDFLNIILTSVFFIRMAKKWCENENVFSILKYLSYFSFWLFAIHMPFLEPAFIKLWARFLPINGFYGLISFFCVVIITMCFGTISGIIVKKYIPLLFKLLNGGRG